MNQSEHPIAIIGSGVVGSATGTGLAAKGHRVVFCDTNPERVALLSGRGYDAVRAEELPSLQAAAYLISVPTPTVEERVDISFVREAAIAVGRAIGRSQGHPLVVVRSTVPPGTTEQIVVPTLEMASDLKPGRDFSVCTNPEFLRANSAFEDFLKPRVIVIGALDQESERAMREIYAPWTDVPILAMSLRSAEAAKYVANLFNATKISFFNEMDRFLREIEAEPAAAFAAAAIGAEGLWNPTYGTRAGFPYGGGCLPKDTVGFLGYARDAGLDQLLPVLQAAMRVNEEMWSVASPIDDGSSRPVEDAL